MQISFAVVPFDHDGMFAELMQHGKPKDGVRIICVDPRGLLKGFDANVLDTATGGKFLELCGGNGMGSQRFLLLKPRREQIEHLWGMLREFPRDSEKLLELSEKLTSILRSAKNCLDEHGDRAAMLIS